MSDQARSLVDELALLSQLELAGPEADALAGQLDRIIQYIQSLQAVDVEGVPEYRGEDFTRSGLRADEPSRDIDPDAALASVPVRHDRLVAVPKFKSDGSEG